MSSQPSVETIPNHRPHSHRHATAARRKPFAALATVAVTIATVGAALFGLAAAANAATPAPIPLTSSSCPTYIQQGQISGCVTKLQQLLNTHGAGIGVDGNFGPGTLAAVKHYQSAHGLSADGVVGPNTKASLDAAAPAPPAPAPGAPAPIPLTSSSCPTDIQQGQVSGCVTKLQQLLNTHGAGIGVNGSFGPSTLTAVKNYQSAHGLSADGVVGPATKASLDGTPATGAGAIVGIATEIKNDDGIQYVWGGGHMSSPGPSTGTCVGDPQSLSCTNPAAIGLDCSGLTRWVYARAFGSDVLGSGNTNNQLARMTKTSSPVPGDLVFFGTSSTTTHHVGIYIGNGQMINAPHTGAQVEIDSIYWPDLLPYGGRP